MLDHRGRPTTFGIEVDKPFSGELARGLNNNLGLPKTASEDMFFSDGIAIPLSGFKVTGLSQGTNIRSVSMVTSMTVELKPSSM